MFQKGEYYSTRSELPAGSPGQARWFVLGGVVWLVFEIFLFWSFLSLTVSVGISFRAHTSSRSSMIYTLSLSFDKRSLCRPAPAPHPYLRAVAVASDDRRRAGWVAERQKNGDLHPAAPRHTPHFWYCECLRLSCGWLKLSLSWEFREVSYRFLVNLCDLWSLPETFDFYQRRMWLTREFTQNSHPKPFFINLCDLWSLTDPASFHFRVCRMWWCIVCTMFVRVTNSSTTGRRWCRRSWTLRCTS